MEKKLVPELRFPEFSGGWEKMRLGEISNYKSSSISLNSLDEYKGKELYPIYDANSICKFVDYYMESEDYISIIKDGAGVGRLRLCKGKSSILGTMGYMSNNNKTKLLFLFYLMQTINFNIYVTGTTIPHIYYKDYKRYNTRIPSIKEQEKVANFFKLIDKKIEKQEEKIASIEEYKKGMLQKLFPKNGENVPEIRFKGFTYPWEQRKLGEVVKRVTRKNKDLESTLPLTISAQDGLIDQNEYFNKTVASRDVSGYYLVKNGEFAYNKSYSNGYPWGAVKRLDRYEMGVLSTLYIVFKTTNIDSDFLVKYYDTTYWHREVSRHAVEGARNHGLLNIAASDFFETELAVPKDSKEQKQIGAFFQHLDHLITLHQRKLEELKELKKGFMQKMFI